MNIARYSISDLEKLTGIKAHTIRIWEKRYSIISPERTDTNIRFYSIIDLQRLLNISFLNKHGFKISLISGMSDSEVKSQVARISEEPGADDGNLSDLIRATNDLDEDRFEKILNGSILKLGFEQAFQSLVFPLVEKINLLWQIGKISACQERFVNNLIRNKLVVAVDGMAGQTRFERDHFLLYLPSGQYDEINLMFANYLLRREGHQVVYLGPSIPVEHLKSLSNRQIIGNIVVSINTGYTDKELTSYTEKLVSIFPGKRIYLIRIGLDFQGVLPEEIIRISSYKGLIQATAV